LPALHTHSATKLRKLKREVINFCIYKEINFLFIKTKTKMKKPLLTLMLAPSLHLAQTAQQTTEPTERKNQKPPTNRNSEVTV